MSAWISFRNELCTSPSTCPPPTCSHVCKKYASRSDCGRLLAYGSDTTDSGNYCSYLFMFPLPPLQLLGYASFRTWTKTSTCLVQNCCLVKQMLAGPDDFLRHWALPSIWGRVEWRLPECLYLAVGLRCPNHVLKRLEHKTIIDDYDELWL